MPERDAYPDGPRRFVLVGPPGTGKTTAIVDGFLVPAVAAVGSRSVLSCSFSRAAAGELRERLARRLKVDPSALRATCRTVHSEALRLVIQRYGRLEILGGRPARDLDDDAGEDDEAAGEPEPADVAARRLAPFRDLRSGDPAAQALEVWELARARRIGLDDPRFGAVARERAPRLRLDEVRYWVETYEAAKLDAGAIDFANMLELALDCEPAHRELVVLDEAQDCSGLQWSLLRRWADAAERALVVGDEDQAIHEWAGADRRGLRDRIDDGYEARRLSRSWRVPRAAHALARCIITGVSERLDAPYSPADRDGSVNVATVAQAVDEVEAAALAGRSAFVLARANRLLLRWGEALRDRGVPFSGPLSPLGAPVAVAVARAVVALRANVPADLADAARLVAALPVRRSRYFVVGVRKGAVVRSLRASRSRGIDAVGLLARGVRTEPLLGLGLAEALLAANVRGADALARLVELHGAGVLRDAPTVELLTAHRSKGREADLVVIDGEAPAPVAQALAAGDREARDAERRLSYVAVTRSRDELLIFRPTQRDWFTLLGVNPT